MSNTQALLDDENQADRRVSGSNFSSSPYYNIFLLAMAWALTLTTSTLLTTLGPLSAVHLDASNALAAFTIGAFLIGAAVSSVPSGWLFRKYGRLMVFLLGCFFQLVGSVLSSLAMITKDLSMLYFGCFAIGLGQGIGQFYRFSAVEVAPKDLKSRAVTYVLSGGIIAAFLGPTIANRGKNLFQTDFLGSFVIIAVIAFMNVVVVLLVKFPKAPTAHEKRQNSRSLSQSSETSFTSVQSSSSQKIRSTYEIISQPLFIISCTVATLAHTIMVMIMSNVSVCMDDHGFNFEHSALVMEVHFFAMFVPGFFSGMLIEKQGTFTVSLIGGLIFAASSVVLAEDDNDWNYMLGMILVGVAWNFSFSAGTLMLTHCYKPIEATEVQAVNDFILFTIAGAGSLASGYIYELWGWLMLIYVCSGLMVAYLLLFTFIWFYAVPTTGVDEKSLLDVSVASDGSRPPSRMASGDYNDAARPSDILRGGSASVADRILRSISGESQQDRMFSVNGSFSGGRAPRGSSFVYEATAPNDPDHPDYDSSQKVRSVSVA